tara:strand:+ start:524 stop:961 length:438 start_codon:yes stop_codon:yes gene_type:complete
MILVLFDSHEINREIINVSEHELILFEDAYYAVFGSDLIDFVIDTIQTEIIINQGTYRKVIEVECRLMYEMHKRRYCIDKKFNLEKNSFDLYKKGCFECYFEVPFMSVLCERISEEIKKFNSEYLSGKYDNLLIDCDYPKQEVVA